MTSILVSDWMVTWIEIRRVCIQTDWGSVANLAKKRRYLMESLKDIIHLRRVPAHPVVDCVLHVAEPLLVVVDHVVIGHPARSPQLYNVQDLNTGDKLQLLVPRGCAEHGHEFVQLVLVESV